MRERTILIGGFSKAYAMTGWRIGYVAAPAGLMTGIAKVHQYGIMCAPTSAQFAAIEALRIGEPFVRAMHDEYDRRRRLMTDRLNRMGLLCFEPKGAFYCFPNVTDATGLDEETFAQRLLAEERVAVVPGVAFGPSGAGHVRACYATAYEEIVEAMDRMEQFVASMPGRAAAAAQGLADAGPASLGFERQGIGQEVEDEPREAFRLLQVDHVGHALEELEACIGDVASQAAAGRHRGRSSRSPSITRVGTAISRSRLTAGGSRRSGCGSSAPWSR